jgi:hypothetical protein
VTTVSSVPDPDPYVFAPPDPLVRGADPDPPISKNSKKTLDRFCDFFMTFYRVADPDVFGSHGFFYNQAKIVRKTLIPNVLRHL